MILSGRSWGTDYQADGAPPGTRTPNPLILGPLFRLVADRRDDLEFSRLRTLDVCGRLVLFMRH